MPLNLNRHQVRYRGKVQGVGFRFTAQRVAADLDVTGFVQNLPDGSVLLVAEGSREELTRLAAGIERELGRNIHSAETEHLPATGEFENFSVRY